MKLIKANTQNLTRGTAEMRSDAKAVYELPGRLFADRQWRSFGWLDPHAQDWTPEGLLQAALAEFPELEHWFAMTIIHESCGISSWWTYAKEA